MVVDIKYLALSLRDFEGSIGDMLNKNKEAAKFRSCSAIILRRQPRVIRLSDKAVGRGTVLRFLLLIGAAQTITAPMNCTRLAHLAVDADGAPNSYRVDGLGLSFTCDGVFARVKGVAQTQKNNPTNWQDLCHRNWQLARRTGDYGGVKIVGFETDKNGNPILQGKDDPYPNEAYVTTNTLPVPNNGHGLQSRYVNALEIPYVVISAAYAMRYKLDPGDLVALYRPKTGKLAFAVFGDCCSIGEASVRAHQDLGSQPITIDRRGTKRANRSIEDPVWMIALTGAHTHATLDSATWRREIESRGEAAFAALGGLKSLNSCINKI